MKIKRQMLSSILSKAGELVMMECKDWIILVVPIICNGIIIFVFQKILSKKIERQSKRQDIRDDVLKKFWNKLQGLNDTFIQMNIAVMRDSKVVGNWLNICQNVIWDIIQYYDTNEFDLKVFAEEYNDFRNSWINFENTCRNYAGKRRNCEMQEQLGKKLQMVKEKNQVLISKVRKKY